MVSISDSDVDFFKEPERELGKHRFMGGTCVDCGHPLDKVCTAVPGEVKIRTPFETFTGPTCKGSLQLGSACGTCEKCAWERQQQANAIPSQSESQNLRYAEQLVKSMAAKHYPENTQFQPLSGDMFGLLMQIDNMLTGLQRDPSKP